MREVAWVVFDEIHYMRDKERGVVWEETIILLPHTVRYVFLSATIPNAMQFAEWICKSHDQPCHVVYTDFRPTPLQHYMFPSGGEGIYLVVNEKGEFREDNFSKAMGKLQQGKGEDPADPWGGKGKKGKGKAMEEKELYVPNNGDDLEFLPWPKGMFTTFCPLSCRMQLIDDRLNRCRRRLQAGWAISGSYPPRQVPLWFRSGQTGPAHGGRPARKASPPKSRGG